MLNKNLLTLSITTLIIACSNPAKASSSVISAGVLTLIEVGITNRATVRNNCAVYQDIIRSIQLKITENGVYHSQKRVFILSKLNELETRLKKQMGKMASFSSVIVPELEDYLYEARQAAERFDYVRLNSLVEQSYQEFDRIKNL